MTKIIMGDIQKTFTITLPSNHDGDSLVECLLILKIVARTYPQYFDIAYQALERLYSLEPERQQLMEEEL